MAFRIASGCKKYEDEDEEDDDDDEWRVVKALFHQSINQVAEERGEKTKATSKASRQKEVPLCVASRMDGWMDRWTNR